MKRKVNVYIDFNNLNFTIWSINKEKYQNINLRKLAQNFINPEKQEIQNIYIFSAQNEILTKEKMENEKIIQIFGRTSKFRHNFIKDKQELIKLKFENNFINFLYSKFQKIFTPKSFVFDSIKEKQNDINLNIKVLEDAMKNKFDDAMIISGSNDVVPCIKAINRNFDSKQIIAIFPQKYYSQELQKLANKTYKIETRHLNNSL